MTKKLKIAAAVLVPLMALGGFKFYQFYDETLYHIKDTELPNAPLFTKIDLSKKGVTQFDFEVKDEDFYWITIEHSVLAIVTNKSDYLRINDEMRAKLRSENKQLGELFINCKGIPDGAILTITPKNTDLPIYQAGKGVCKTNKPSNPHWYKLPKGQYKLIFEVLNANKEIENINLVLVISEMHWTNFHYIGPIIAPVFDFIGRIFGFILDSQYSLLGLCFFLVFLIFFRFITLWKGKS